MKERQTSDNGVFILSDADLDTTPDARWFQPAWWARDGKPLPDLGGRGGARVVVTPLGRAVLRRYHRGGLLGPLLRDRYLRTGADRSRCFREFRLLAALRARRLPVPAPIAAAYEPALVVYRAALLTRLIPDAQQLAEVAADLSSRDWAALAATLHEFFQAGLVHPDLNARNILLDASGGWHLLDLDRARIMGQPVSGRGMMARLARSLEKTASPGWRRGFEAHLSAAIHR